MTNKNLSDLKEFGQTKGPFSAQWNQSNEVMMVNPFHIEHKFTKELQELIKLCFLRYHWILMELVLVFLTLKFEIILELN